MDESVPENAQGDHQKATGRETEKMMEIPPPNELWDWDVLCAIANGYSLATGKSISVFAVPDLIAKKRAEVAGKVSG
jgi:hypothetical protein